MIGLGPRRDLGLERGGIELPRLPIGVDEHGRGAAVAHGARRRDEGEARHQHLVAGPDAGRHERQVQRDRAVGDGHAVGRRR